MNTYIALDSYLDYLSGSFTHTMNVDRLTGGSSAGGDANALGGTIVFLIPIILASAEYFKKFYMKICSCFSFIIHDNVNGHNSFSKCLGCFYWNSNFQPFFFARNKALNFTLVFFLNDLWLVFVTSTVSG